MAGMDGSPSSTPSAETPPHGGPLAPWGTLAATLLLLSASGFIVAGDGAATSPKRAPVVEAVPDALPGRAPGAPTRDGVAPTRDPVAPVDDRQVRLERLASAMVSALAAGELEEAGRLALRHERRTGCTVAWPSISLDPSLEDLAAEERRGRVRLLRAYGADPAVGVVAHVEAPSRSVPAQVVHLVAAESCPEDPAVA